MKKLSFVFVFIVCASFTMTFLPSKSSGKNEKLFRTERSIPNRYIVVLEDSENESFRFDSERKVEEITSVYGGRADKIFTSAVKGFAAEMTVEEAEAKLGELKEKGPSPSAFTFKKRFPPPA